MCSSEHCREAWNLVRALLAGGDRAAGWSHTPGPQALAVVGLRSGGRILEQPRHPGSKQWVRGTGATAAGVQDMAEQLSWGEGRAGAMDLLAVYCQLVELGC